MTSSAKKGSRRVRFILINVIRVLLIAIFYFSLTQNRKLIMLSTILAFVMTLIPSAYSKIFKRESVALFDIILIVIIFGLFSFWEIRGVYSNSLTLAFMMNLAEALAIGLMGFTLVYSIFKHSKLEENLHAIAFFSFCLSFSLGTLSEIAEMSIDSLLKFRINSAGMYGTMGDLIIFFAGSLVVSIGGYHSLKRGKPILVSTYIESIVQKNPEIFGIKGLIEHDPEHISSMIKKGESERLEFKSTLRKNLHTNNFDKQIEHAALKTINAYLNSNGGTLLIGVTDKGEIIGLEKDQFANDDHAQRHLMQLVNTHIGPEFSHLINANLIKVDGKSLLKVECKKSDKEAFVRNGADEHFYVRLGSLSTPLSGSSLLKYIENNFRTK